MTFMFFLHLLYIDLLANVVSKVRELSREGQQALLRQMVPHRTAYCEIDGVENVMVMDDVKEGDLLFWSCGAVVNTTQLRRANKEEKEDLYQFARRIPKYERGNARKHFVTFYTGSSHINRIRSTDTDCTDASAANVEYFLHEDEERTEMCTERSYVYFYATKDIPRDSTLIVQL